MNWLTIKKDIIVYLIANKERELVTPDRRLRKLDKIEQLLPKEYLDAPIKLLLIDKKELISSLKIRSDAGKSVINNIYDILDGIPLKSRRKSKGGDNCRE